MNVLEKILEDIDERKLSHKQKLEIEVGGRSVGEIRERISELNLVAEIIRSYIDEYKDTNVISNDGWIPVEERLPEEHNSMFAKFKGTDMWNDVMFEKISDEVNVTIELEDGTRTTTTSYTLDGKWKVEKEQQVVKKKVTAWQPLPDVYKPEEKSKESN